MDLIRLYSAYVNHAWLRSWNQPLLSNEDKSFLLNETTSDFHLVCTHFRQAIVDYKSDMQYILDILFLRLLVSQELL